MSTYSSNLRIELIDNGTQAGTWGDTTNSNLSTVIDQSVAGLVPVVVASANQALTWVNGPSASAALNQSIRAILSLSTSTTANFAVYAPPVSKLYVVSNTSAYTAMLYNSTVLGNTTAAGTGVAIPAGKTMTVWSDGTNFTFQNTHVVATVVGDVTGNLTGNVTGNLNGNLSSAAPTAPTQPTVTNNTTVATTAFVQAVATAAIQALHPVGSVYINATNGTNPSTLLGFGTWTAFGAGRVPVGFDSGNALFDTAEETGGSADAITVSHTHTATSTDSGHTHTGSLTQSTKQQNGPTPVVSSTESIAGNYNFTTSSGTANITTTIASSGSSGTNANYQPYITVYMWKRTA